ncbi:MAG: hypothetical protein H0W71_05930 [Sphingomonas sp.]|nr:hypothetical protein [Sphingomonas sp.]
MEQGSISPGDAPPERSVALTVEGAHGPIIHAVTAAAAAHGACAGMRLTDARALFPQLTAIPADPDGDRAGQCAGRHWSKSMARMDCAST